MDYPIKANDTARSGWQIKSVLMNHGIKPINSILDRLAYITLLTNCPTHVYDCQKLNGNLSCRQSGDEKKFIALNGKTFTLSPKDILIYDSVQPVSIAAVIGSDNTKLTSNTTNVKIEIGNFDYAQVRTTSIRLNCETDSSKKASRPLSTYLNLLALYLIKNEFGKPDRQTIYCNKNWNKTKIDIDYEKLA
ncbi:MAG: B3/4 domain-containing protein [Mycoplasmoidaceae bacterium]|nr:B3/4 domain-containing protein [Mycoplasmoidaceae bacterium]